MCDRNHRLLKSAMSGSMADMGKTVISATLVVTMLVASGSAWIMPSTVTSAPAPGMHPQHQMQGNGHSCCPGMHPRAILLQVPPAGGPCSDQHRCCVASQKPASLSSASSERESGAEQSTRRAVASRSVIGNALPSHPQAYSPLLIRTVVLRI